MKLNEQLMIEIQENLNDKLVPMLVGEPGNGMLNWINDLPEIMKTQMFCVSCDRLIDKNDLLGFQFVTTDDSGNYQKETRVNKTIDDAIKYAIANPQETPILVLDSIDRATSEIINTALALPIQQQIGETTLPENLRIIIIAHTKDTSWLNATLLSRFAIKSIDAPKKRY